MQEKLRDIMAQALKIPLEQITEETSVETIESWDSLNHINLILALEHGFGTTFAPEEIVQMVSFHEILTVLKGKVTV
jgi:acyl carrier protein